MAIALSTHIKRKRTSIIDATQQPSESSETVHQPSHKKVRQEQSSHGSASPDSQSESDTIKSTPSDDFDQVDLGMDGFQEVSHEEYQSHMLSKMSIYINDLKFLRNERAEFQEKMKARGRQTMALKRMVNALQAERASLKEELLEKDQQIETLGLKHKRDLQNARKTLLLQDASRTSLSKQQAKYQDILRAGRQQMDILHMEIEELQQKNEGLELLIESKDQIDELSQEASANDQSHEDLKRELSRLQEENKILKENAEKDRVRQENQSQTRQEEIAKLQNEKAALEGKIQKLQDSVKMTLPNEVDVVSVGSNSTDNRSTLCGVESSLVIWRK